MTKDQIERIEKAKLKALRKAIQIGIDDIEAGRYRDFDNVDDLDRYLKALSDKVIRGARRG